MQVQEQLFTLSWKHITTLTIYKKTVHISIHGRLVLKFHYTEMTTLFKRPQTDIHHESKLSLQIATKKRLTCASNLLKYNSPKSTMVNFSKVYMSTSAVISA